MYPDTDACPDIPYELLTPRHHLFDLIYNPAETLFLAKGKARGATVQNGQEMLELQAEESWKIWNG
jgi:shikimate dehydrogenase